MKKNIKFVIPALAASICLATDVQAGQASRGVGKIGGVSKTSGNTIAPHLRVRTGMAGELSNSISPPASANAVTRSYTPPPPKTVMPATMTPVTPPATTVKTANAGSINTTTPKRSPKMGSITSTTTEGKTIYPGPYAHLPDTKNPGPGKDFTKSQKRAIRAENASRYQWTNRSDLDGQEIKPGKVHIDHIDPKSKGGPNTIGNAQLLTDKQNILKSNKTGPTVRTTMPQIRTGMVSYK